MASFPFLPYRNYYNYYPKYYNPNISPNMVNQERKVQAQENPKQENDEYNRQNVQKTNANIEQETRAKEKSSRYSFGPISFNSAFLSGSEEPVLEILGIQLYLDDIIILGLLFFLYKEGVKDEMLFIILILLLLS